MVNFDFRRQFFFPMKKNLLKIQAISDTIHCQTPILFSGAPGIYFFSIVLWLARPCLKLMKPVIIKNYRNYTVFPPISLAKVLLSQIYEFQIFFPGTENIFPISVL